MNGAITWRNNTKMIFTLSTMVLLLLFFMAIECLAQIKQQRDKTYNDWVDNRPDGCTTHIAKVIR